MSSERWDQSVAANIAMANSALGRDTPAGSRAADLENILHLIVAQLADTDRRQTETMQHMQDRLDLIGAEANAIRSRVPHTSQPTMDRISESIARLAASLDRGNPKPAGPAHTAHPQANAPETTDPPYGYGYPYDHHASVSANANAADDTSEPWDRQSADALAAVYDGFGAAAPQTQSAPPAPYPQRQRRTSEPVEIRCSSDVDRSWIDAKLNEVAVRLEQSLADMRPDSAFLAIGQRFDLFEDRFGSFMETAATRTDVESLRLVEAHLGEVQGNLHHLGTQLTRLDTIEDQLRTLAERIEASPFADGAASGMNDVEAVAASAADRVVERLAAADGADVLSRHIEPVRTLLEDMSRERRRGEANTTAILDTLQQAMLRVLDRVDAIDVSQLPAEQPVIIAEMPPVAEPEEAGLDDELYDLTRYGNPLTAPAPHDRIETADEDTPPPFDAPAAPLAAVDAPARPSADKLRRDLVADLLRARERANREENDNDNEKAAPEEPQVRESGAGLRPKKREAWFGSTLTKVLIGLSMLVAAGAGAAVVVSRNVAVAADPAPAAFQKQTGALPREGSYKATNAGHESVPGVALHDSEDLDPEQVRRIANRQKMARISDGLGLSAARATPVSLTPADQLAPTIDDGPNAPAAVTGAVSSNRLDMPPATVGPLSLRLAAAKGDASAEFEVASRLASGKGTDQNLKEAVRWYQKAATQGFAQAQYRLGTLYERGLGTKADLGRAGVWYKRAAEQGSIKAMHNLAVLSASQGSGGADYSGAAKWFKIAAEHGLPESQYNLAILYESGLGVERDLVQAYKWLAIAARSGDGQAIDRRDRIKAAIDPEAVVATDATIGSWRAKTADPLVNDARVAGEAWKSRLHSGDNS